MPRKNTIINLRTTKANLDLQAAANNLNLGEQYVVTDQDGRIATGTGPGTYRFTQIRGVSGGCAGVPANDQVIMDAIAPYDIVFDETQCFARARIAATASAVFTISKTTSADVTTTVGTVTFAIGSKIGVVDITAPNIARGDAVSIKGPATADATLAGVSVTLLESPGITVAAPMARAASTNANTFVHSGHSLTDAYVHYGEWPGNLRRLASSIGITSAEAKHVKSAFPGSSIQYRYEYDLLNDNGERAFSNANLFDTLMITERGPPPHYMHPEEEEFTHTLDYLCRFAANQIENGRADELILWTIWPDLRGAGFGESPTGWAGRTFLESLPDYGRTFRFYAEYVTWKMKQLYPSLPSTYRAWVFPGDEWMLRVRADIATGGIVPGITNITQLFEDDIHPNTWGVYGLACLVITGLYQVNLSEETGVYIQPSYVDHASVTQPALSPSLAAYFWDIAWDIASNEASVGMGGTHNVAPTWQLGVQGDFMPNWTLADPDTTPGEPPDPGGEATLPLDTLGWFNRSTVTGLTFSPTLPAESGGYRSLTVEHKAPTTGIRYVAWRGRSPVAAQRPLPAVMCSVNDVGLGDTLQMSINFWTSRFASHAQRYDTPYEQGNEVTGTTPDTAVHTVEMWFDTATNSHSIAVDGVYTAAPLAVVGTAMASFNYLSMAIDWGGPVDTTALAVLNRIPNTGERTNIRAWLTAQDAPAAAIPGDALGIVSPSSITGFTFDPALPAVSSGYRAVTGEHTAPATGVMYNAIRFKLNAINGPVIAMMGQNPNSWSGNAVRTVAHGGWDQFAAFWMLGDGSDPSDLRETGAVRDLLPHTLETWVDPATDTFYLCLDGGTVRSRTVTDNIQANFAHVLYNVDGGPGFDLKGFTALNRIPSDSERAGIRAALAAM